MNLAEVQNKANLAKDIYDDRKENYKKNNRVYIGDHGYKIIYLKENPKTGFYGAVYQDLESKQLTIAYRGTNLFANYGADLLTDAQMMLTTTNNQMNDAYELTQWAVNTVKKHNQNFPGQKIDPPHLTGHSLGGTLAQMMAYSFNLKADTYNAFGAVSLKTKLPDGRETYIPQAAPDNVHNHVSQGDKISTIRDQYGKTFVYHNPLEQKIRESSLSYAQKKLSLNDHMANLFSQSYTYLQGLFGSLHSRDNFIGKQSVINNPSKEVKLHSWQQEIKPIENYFFEKFEYLKNITDAIWTFAQNEKTQDMHIAAKKRKEIWQGMTQKEIETWAVKNQGMDPDLLPSDPAMSLSMIAMYTQDKELSQIAKQAMQTAHGQELKEEIQQAMLEKKAEQQRLIAEQEQENQQIVRTLVNSRTI